MTPPPPAEGRTRLVEDLLNWVNTPWRAGFLLILMILGATGYGLWSVRVELADHVLKNQPAPHLKPDAFPKLAQRLIDNSDADLVLLIEVDFPSDHVQSVDGRLKGDADWRPRPAPRELLESGVDVRQLADLISGKAVCASLAGQGDGARADVALGMVWRCVAGVPAVFGVFVGAVETAWRTPPHPIIQEGAVNEMLRMANSLAVW